jgi:hypothetical protein
VAARQARIRRSWSPTFLKCTVALTALGQQFRPLQVDDIPSPSSFRRETGMKYTDTYLETRAGLSEQINARTSNVLRTRTIIAWFFYFACWDIFDVLVCKTNLIPRCILSIFPDWTLRLLVGDLFDFRAAASRTFWSPFTLEAAWHTIEWGISHACRLPYMAVSCCAAASRGLHLTRETSLEPSSTA